MRKFVCMSLTLVLVLSFATVFFADKTIAAEAREIDAVELEKFKIQSLDKIGERKFIDSGKTRTWKIRNISPKYKKVFLAFRFDHYEDGTPIVVNLINIDTGEVYKPWSGRLSEENDMRHIYFYIGTNDRYDYQLEITHDNEKYAPFYVTPYLER